jgi:hypothetical protein
VAATGASQGLEGPPSTPSMRDLRVRVAVSHVCVLVARGRGGGASAPRVSAAVVAPRAPRPGGERALVSKTPTPHELDA